MLSPRAVAVPGTAAAIEALREGDLHVTKRFDDSILIFKDLRECCLEVHPRKHSEEVGGVV